MSQEMARQVLVTDGTGFVESRIVERLLGNDYYVSCLVRDLGQLRWVKGMDVRLIQGDCTQSESLAATVQGVSFVFHYAGLTNAIFFSKASIPPHDHNDLPPAYNLDYMKRCGLSKSRNLNAYIIVSTKRESHESSWRKFNHRAGGLGLLSASPG